MKQTIYLTESELKGIISEALQNYMGSTSKIKEFLNSGWDISDPNNLEMTLDAIGRLKGYIPENVYNYISNLAMELQKEPENKMRCQNIADTIRSEVKNCR